MSSHPQSYVSALLAKTLCHDDGVVDSELDVLLQAVPPADTQKSSLLRCIPVVFADDKSCHPEWLQLLQENPEPHAD